MDITALTGHGATDLQRAIDGLAINGPELEGEELAAAEAAHAEHERMKGLISQTSKVIGGIAHIRLPRGAKLAIFDREFFVFEVSRRKIKLIVNSLPKEWTEGRTVKIFDGHFLVGKCCAQTRKTPAFTELTPKDKYTRINPKPLPPR